MLEKVMTGLASVRDPKRVRERFEEDLRAIVRAKSVKLRDDSEESRAPGVIACDLPGPAADGRPRIEAVFDPARPVDARARHLLSAGAQVARLLLEIERAHGRWPLASARSHGDGAAPLIGSSRPIRILRDRIERVPQHCDYRPPWDGFCCEFLVLYSRNADGVAHSIVNSAKAVEAILPDKPCRSRQHAAELVTVVASQEILKAMYWEHIPWC